MCCIQIYDFCNDEKLHDVQDSADLRCKFKTCFLTHMIVLVRRWSMWSFSITSCVSVWGDWEQRGYENAHDVFLRNFLIVRRNLFKLSLKLRCSHKSFEQRQSSNHQDLLSLWLISLLSFMKNSELWHVACLFTNMIRNLHQLHFFTSNKSRRRNVRMNRTLCVWHGLNHEAFSDASFQLSW